MSILAIIQARMGSTRLPGKVLLSLAGEPVLAHVVRRTLKAGTIDGVVVATTLRAEDQDIVDLCSARGWACHRGSELDLLDRYRGASRQHNASAVVRITSDCPLIDPEIIDRVVTEFLRAPPVDFAHEVNFPLGLSVEVMRSEALERAWREDHNPTWREHVTPYIYRHPEIFKLRTVSNGIDLSDLRWTLDTPEDFELLSLVYENFGSSSFSWRDVLSLLKQNPGWAEINRSVPQKSVPW